VEAGVQIQSPRDGYVGGRVDGLFACPDCGASTFDSVWDGEMTNFRCVSCHACWHLELGWTSRVDAARCPDCPLHADCEPGV
jgi:DNA-directed RNA polymerase subunit RPC12/RpoP